MNTFRCLASGRGPFLHSQFGALNFPLRYAFPAAGMFLMVPRLYCVSLRFSSSCQFLPLSPSISFHVWLRNYSLGTLIDLQGISSGIENTNYFVTTSHGKYVLTLFEKLTSSDLPYYLNLMAYLSRHGIPCPSPVADLDNKFLGELNGKPASIVTCLPGKSQEYPTPSALRGSGGASGEHASVRAVLSGKNGEFARTKMVENCRTGTSCRFSPRRRQTVLKEELRFQSSYRFENLPRGVIHADLFRDNVLFNDGAIGGVIDFYFACNDVLLYDLAITANDWCLDENGELDAGRTLSLLEAYHAPARLRILERNAWPVMLRAAALRFWLSRLHDFHLPRAGELTHVKDPGSLHAHIEESCGFSPRTGRGLGLSRQVRQVKP